jgi:hypothetical protein
VTFTASALVVAWGAIALLGLALSAVVARLHRVEQRLESPPLVGRRLPELGPGLTLLVERGCASCDAAVAAAGDHDAVLWREDAPDLFDELGISVTPYGLVTDAAGVVLAAGPAGSEDRRRALRRAVP